VDVNQNSPILVSQEYVPRKLSSPFISAQSYPVPCVPIYKRSFYWKHNQGLLNSVSLIVLSLNHNRSCRSLAFGPLNEYYIKGPICPPHTNSVITAARIFTLMKNYVFRSLMGGAHCQDLNPFPRAHLVTRDRN
jgi:hypothetical protein